MKKTKSVKTANKKAPLLKTRKLSEELLRQVMGGQMGACQCICQSHCGAQSHCTPD
jgi:hypothetical protein